MFNGKKLNDASLNKINGGVVVPQKRTGDKFVIDSNACVHCGECYNVCNRRAIFDNNGHYEIDDSLCNKCGACRDKCPSQNAIVYQE